LLTGALIVLSPGCHSAPKFPEKNSKAYADVVSAFYVGLSALQVGDDVHAESKLSEVTRLVPREPAGWANWGILSLRQRNYEEAAQRFQRARDLVPKNDQLYSLMGLLESQRGNSAQALADLHQAVELNPHNLRALYQLAEETERQGASNSEAEFQQLVQKILVSQPKNLAALLELSRIAAKQGDAATVKSAVAKSAHSLQAGRLKCSASWPRFRPRFPAAIYALRRRKQLFSATS
jgi:Flp pilus assembly protein TadD